MRIFNPQSLVFKTVLIYIFLTILNVSIFVLMVFENQLDLIAENAILTSQHKASSLKYRIDNIIGTGSDLTPVNINKIIKDASELGIQTIALFNEGGKIYVNIVRNRIIEKNTADLDELKMINMAITKQGFEDKLFYHHVKRKEKLINLYIPFAFGEDKIGVAAIELEMKDIDKQMGYLYRQCILIGFLVAVLHIGFAFLISKMILLPLRKLNEATDMISKGNLDIHIPIVRNDEIGQLATSFNEMGTALKRQRDEDKGANPLTGLPGNVKIAQYIDECLMKNRIIAVLYCDLDNFKAYNDKYGFTRGDDAILYTRDCLDVAAKRKDVADIFIGHEGGDDFVVVTPFECWEIFAKTFISTFDRGIYQFYTTVDNKNGFIESVNRKGERQRFPLMSISVAVVSNKTRPFRRHAEIIAVAAEVKKYVKSQEGSCYAIDRRTGPISPTQQIDRSVIDDAKNSISGARS
jgi:GGDEF domain-containing protein